MSNDDLTYMNTEQKKIIAKSFLFIIVFFVSAIFIYYTIFAQFVPTSYSYTVIDITNKKVNAIVWAENANFRHADYDSLHNFKFETIRFQCSVNAKSIAVQ